MSLLTNPNTTVTFKLHILPWQRSEKHRNTTFLQFWVYFSPFNIIFNYRPTLRTISYYEIIMKYHQEILYAKYHFVRRVGWYLKIKKMCSEMVKNRPKSANCALSMVLVGVAMATLVG